MSDNQIIQLLPESRREIEVKIPGENKPLFLGLGAVGIVLVLFLGLQFYSSSFQNKINELDIESKALDSRREKDTEDKIILLKDQFNKVGNILDNHVILSYLFKKIQAKTSPQIQFKSIKISLTDQKVDSEAEVANYTVLARQIVSYLSDEMIKDVKINEAKVFPNGRLGINMTLVFNAGDLMLKAISDKAISGSSR